MSAADAHGTLQMVRHEMRHYRGPLPDPETLEHYKRIDPRFPDAILKSFSSQTEHRHKMESIYLHGSEKRANRGQWLGTGLLGCGIAGGVIVTLAGHEVTGGIMAGASLAIGAISYVFGDFRPGKSAKQDE